MRIASSDITEAFERCGVMKGSILMLHVDAIFLSQLPIMHSNDRYQILFKSIFEVLGKEGTLLIPTFSYSATNNESYNAEETPSAVGGFSEYFRQFPNVIRSKDPIFSIAAYGKNAEDFMNINFEDSFGLNSIFSKLLEHNVIISTLACSFNRVTFTHYVERVNNVDYRYDKYFRYSIIDEDKTITGKIKYFVRDLERDTRTDLSLLKSRMMSKNKFMQVPIGRFLLNKVYCKDFYEEATALLLENPNALIREQ